MRKSIALALVLAVGTICASVARADGALRWSYEYVLATSTVDGQLYQVVTGVIEDAALRDPAMCDLLAEVMASLSARKIRAEKTYPALLRVLANVPNAARYRDVVKTSRKFITGPGAEKFVNRYLENMRRSKEPQYIPGTVDLAARRDGYARSALAVEPTPEQAQALATMPDSVSIDDLFALAGTPAAAGTRDMLFVASMGVDIRQLWLYYRGIGRVTFDYKSKFGWHLQEFVADPMAFEGFMPYRDKAAEFGLPDDATISLIQLLSANPAAIKVSAQDTYRRGNAPGQYMDAAAELLLQRYAAVSNTPAADAYGWICNVLHDLGGQRYARVVATVAKRASDEKLRKFSGIDVKRLPDDPGESYVPGTVSLAELAKKFPALYPRMTLIRGLP